MREKLNVENLQRSSEPAEACACFDESYRQVKAAGKQAGAKAAERTKNVRINLTSEQDQK